MVRIYLAAIRTYCARWKAPNRTRRKSRAIVLPPEVMEARLCLSGLTPSLGVYRSYNGIQTYHIDDNIDGRTDSLRSYGLSTDVPVFGDFTGTTVTNIGVYRPSDGTWHLDLRNNGGTTVVVQFGGPDWMPITGDVDGNGTTDLGIYNPKTGVWQFRTTLGGQPTVTFRYGGSAGDVPLMADFNHDGKDDPVIYNNGQWLVDTNSDRIPDLTYKFGGGMPNATPVLFDLYGNHNPGLAVAAPNAAGQLIWYINPNRDGVTVGQYGYGATGDKPFSGYFSTANSLFVNPAIGVDAASSGGVFTPYRTINAALNAVPSGGIVRLQAGAYAENVKVIQKSNIKIVGVGLQTSVIFPSTGDAVQVFNSDNVSFDNLWLAAAGTDGRGLAILGSSVNTGLVRTDMTRWIGVVATAYQGRPSTLNALYTQFNGVQVGNGLYLQSGSTAFLDGCSINYNGLSPNVRADSAGMVLVGDAKAVINGSVFIGNHDSGLVAHGTSQVSMQLSYLANSVQGNGALFFEQTTARLVSNTFQSNGRVFGAVSGFNGVEFYVDFAGYAFISGNVFRGNTANGLFIGRAPNTISVIGNVFDGNFAQINFFASNGPANAVIQGNYFTVPLNYPEPRFGVAGVGSMVNATIGGPGAAMNIFENFPDYLFIDPSHTGGTPLQNLGCPKFNILANIYRRGGQPVDPSMTTHPC